ncbi:HK97 family phage prohead protease [Curtobacterium sp. MCBD17_008]|uniref:HK97 family phage prohead protease n=1 Tax=Curtobacterium sp. MCBD17_008 TaxID=2175656 RepID=UPI000DA7B578|nr:HK97 family phage prohead protease [Curtobacterium sp. MCBD17_008]PZE89948.1 HK97 family phage prohead protease [Curtobacterium sp. MCBD17_008]
MLTKQAPVAVKAAGTEDGLEDGQFRAVVSVFGNEDSYGDVVQPGAFAKTLADWAAKGDPIPVYWSHRMDDPDYNIGYVVEAKETDQGLEVLAQIDLDGAKAQQVYRLLKGRRVTQFSFAYDVVNGAWVVEDGREFYSLNELKLYEVGPTPIGANQETELIGVKSAADRLTHDLKAGRVFSAKNEDEMRNALASLDAARDGLTKLLAELDPSDDEDTSKASAGAAKDEEPPAAKSEEPNRASAELRRIELNLI